MPHKIFLATLPKLRPPLEAEAQLWPLIKTPAARCSFRASGWVAEQIWDPVNCRIEAAKSRLDIERAESLSPSSRPLEAAEKLHNKLVRYEMICLWHTKATDLIIWRCQATASR